MYAFTVDTLAYPSYASQTNMYAITGTSSSNVFTVGHNSSSAAGSMFRFDGARWRTTGFSREEGGPISGSLDLFSVLAFSASDVWFAGALFPQNPNPPPITVDSSLLAQYDGVNWVEHKIHGARELLSVHGTASNDVWACGVSKTLLHYNGLNWESDSIPISASLNGGIILRNIFAISPQTVYMIGFGFVVDSGISRETYQYFLNRSGGRWVVVDSVELNSDADYRWGTLGLWAGPSGTLYSLSPVGVWRWNGSQWTRILVWNGGPLQSIWGYNDNNFFVGGYRTLLHYNGTDFYQYPNVSGDMVYTGIWGDGKELFVVGNDGNKSYIFHGR
jgi:hypothetical protein